MRVIVLGSAAGGGVPQWNCRCPVCSLAWSGDPRVKRRTQSSIAATGDSETFVLINASPDLRQQILSEPALQPQRTARSSPIKACILTNAEIDHLAGLLTLRERQAFALYATSATLSALNANPIFSVLATECVRREPIVLDGSFAPVPGLSFRALATAGKVALWQENEKVAPGAGEEGGVALELRSGDKRLIYAPACAKVTPAFRERINGADALLFDGTTFVDDELISLGLAEKSARRMGHMPMAGPEGSIAALADLPLARKIFIHLNNSNPVLIEDSPERRMVEGAGWEVAYDGMEIVL